MDSQEDKQVYLNRAYTWTGKHLRDAVQAIYLEDAATALRCLESAPHALAQSGLPDELKEAITVRLRYTRCQAECIGKPRAEVRRMREAMLTDLRQVTGSSYTSGTAHSYIIQLRTIDQRDYGAPYPSSEFHDDLAQIPEEMFTKELRLYLAAWAFMNGDLDLVDECFAVFMLEADGFMSAFLWQRVNLMQLLMRGTAQARDVEELLALMEHPNHWHDFDMLLLPACIERGLLDDPNTCMILGQTLHDLHAAPKQMPKRRQRTGRIRRD